jgi:site-specific DNA-methyltransferase (adenine-specific)
VNKKKLNHVILGDCLEILKSLPDNFVDHCITDPPYNISGSSGRKKIGWLKSNEVWTAEKNFAIIDEKWDAFSDGDYQDFTLSWVREMTRVVKPNGNIMIFGSYHNIYTVGSVLDQLDLKINNSIIWFKRNAFPNVTGRMLCESTEQIIWAVNGSKRKASKWTFNYEVLKSMTDNGKQMRNMWDIPNTPTSERAHGKHPSQKPLALSERLILGFTKPGDIVLDPFAGSGSFIIAAKMNERNYIGIERDSSYLEIIKKRLA